MENSKVRGNPAVVWMITIVALMMAGVIGQYIFDLISGKHRSPTKLDFITATIAIAICVALLVFAQASRVIFLTEEMKADLDKRLDGLTVVNGFSLAYVSRLIIYCQMLAVNLSEPGGVAPVGEEKSCLELPAHLQENLDKLHRWMEEPRQGFKSKDELVFYLECVNQRYLQEKDKIKLI